MTRWSIGLGMLGLLGLGCGSSAAEPGSTGGNAGSGGAAGSSAGGSGGTAGSGASGGSGGAGGTSTKPPSGPPKNVVGGFKIEVPRTTIGPSDDIYPCWVFPLELTGPSHFVAGATMIAGNGLHHGNVTTRPKTGEGVRPCENSDPLGEATDVLQGGSVLFGSTTQLVGQEWRHFPDGYAYKIKDGYEIVARMHYFNPSNETIETDVSYEWFTVDEATVTTQVAPVFWQIVNYTIPAHSELTVSASCDIPKEMHLLEGMPHMHSRGIAFTASYKGGALAGERFIDSPGYSPDGAIQQFQPAIDMSQGEGFDFTCTWYNDTNRPVQDGASGNQEMCMLFGYAYPASNAYTVSAVPGGSCLGLLPPAP